MKVALALGSGGARGYTHIGALQELEARGHEVVRVAGTSIGAVIGGFYCAGKLQDYTDWVLSLNQRDVLLYMDPAFTGPGVIKADKIMSEIAKLLDGVRIENLKIPFTAVATDVENRREVWFVEGPLDIAMRASMAIPTFIMPVVVNGRLLVDGGVLNPVPVDATHGSNADFTMAISLSGSNPQEKPGHVTESSDPKDGQAEDPTWQSWLASGFGFLDHDRLRLKPNRVRELPGAESGREPLPHGLKTTNLARLAMNSAEALITRYRLAGNPPDVYIQFPGDIASTMDFHRAAELIEIGREATVKALDEAGF